ncbi:MAG: YraN family protein [Candidatus Binatia bacterium]
MTADQQRHGRRALGQQGEREAERFLRTQGYAIVSKNYRCHFGEIDLVALDRQTIVFVEVRTHTGDGLGDPLASVNLRKQRQIAKAALDYLARHRLHDRAARFDVIGIQWQGENARLTHIKEAFDLPRSF